MVKKFTYLVEIYVDEANIDKKYANYKINYDSTQEFAESLVNLTTDKNHKENEALFETNMNDFGYGKKAYRVEHKKKEKNLKG